MRKRQKQRRRRSPRLNAGGGRRRRGSESNSGAWPGEREGGKGAVAHLTYLWGKEYGHGHVLLVELERTRYSRYLFFLVVFTSDVAVYRHQTKRIARVFRPGGYFEIW